MNAMLDSLFAWLLDFAWLATALLLAAHGLRLVLREPRGRVLLAWGTWLAIAVGGVCVTLPGWPRVDVAPWLQAARSDQQVVFVEMEPTTEYVVLNPATLEPVIAPPPFAAPAAPAWPKLPASALGAIAWLTIAAAALGWLAMGLVRAWRLIARSQPAPNWTHDELRQIVGPARRSLPGLLTSKQIASALALGTLRPRIVLPLASATESNAPAVRAALAHEWAHIASGDLWLLALERSLVPLLALHPLFWWLRRLTRLDQELAADAAAAGDKPAEYAQALLDWAKGEPHRRPGVAALAMWERPSNLSRRIRMILDPKRNPSANRGRLSAYAVLALLFTLALGLSIVSWRPMSAQDQPAQDPANPAAAATESQSSGEIRNYPLIGAARLADTPVIMVELQLLSLDPQGLYEAKVDLPVLLKDSQRGDANRAAKMITAELDAKEAGQLVEVVRTAKGTAILSQPKLVTLDNQEATIVVGGQLPLVTVEESVNGQQPERRVEYKDFGTKLRVKPHILLEDPTMVTLEVVGEQSTLNRHPQDGADPNELPRLNSQRVELKGTLELGKTLVVLPAAVQVPTDGDGATKGATEKRLLILLRPSVVEHKYLEVYPHPQLANKARFTRTLAVNAQDEAQLAEQIRNIRQTLEELAREREATRQENAALKAELERLKSQLPAAPQLPGRGAAGGTQHLPPPIRLPAGVANEPQSAAVAQPAIRITRIFEFGSAGEAADAAKILNVDGKLEKLGAALMVSNTTVTLIGTEAALAELSPTLAEKGKLVSEARHATRFSRGHAAIAGLPGLPAHATAAQPAMTRVYILPSNKESAEAVRALAAGFRAEGTPIAIELKENTLTVTGTNSELARIEPMLAAIGKGKLVVQGRTGAGTAQVVADTDAPHSTVVQAIEWFRTHQPDGEVTVKSAASGPSASERRTQRKLLELDLQDAELQLQAAQEDFEAAQQLNKHNAISAEELRMKRRAVDRTMIQVAKLKVMLEADEPPAPNVSGAQPSPASRQ